MALLVGVLFVLFCLITVRDVRYRLVYGEDLALLIAVRVFAAACSLFPDVSMLAAERWGALALGQSFVATLALSLVFWALGFLVSRICGSPALGKGDVLLLGVCGLFVEVWQFDGYLLLVSVSGAVLALVWLLFKKEKTFPFAPAIVWPCWLMLL